MVQDGPERAGLCQPAINDQVSRIAMALLRRSLIIAAAFGATLAHADPAPFDLAGPVLEAKVTRGDSTLPISQVPNLAAGDKIWIKADLPPTQSAHYLLVAAFLSGSTNPAAPELVLPLRDLEQAMWPAGTDGHRARRRAAGAGVSRARRRAAISGRWWARCAAGRARSCAPRRISIRRRSTARAWRRYLVGRSQRWMRPTRRAQGGGTAAGPQPRHQGRREVPRPDSRSCRHPVSWRARSR